MKRSEILNLIEEKEKQYKIFKQKGELKAKHSEEIFHKIKQQVMDDLVKLAVEQGYVFTETQIDYCIWDVMLNSGEFPINNKNCFIVKELYHCSLQGLRVDNTNSFMEVSRYLNSFDRFLLKENFRLLLLKHGFNSGCLTWRTTKENLLKYPEVIYNGGVATSNLQQPTPPTPPTPPTNKESPSITFWQVFVIILVILSGLLFKVFS